MKTGLVLSDKSLAYQRSERTNKQTNEPTNKHAYLPSEGKKTVRGHTPMWQEEPQSKNHIGRLSGGDVCAERLITTQPIINTR